MPYLKPLFLSTQDAAAKFDIPNNVNAAIDNPTGAQTTPAQPATAKAPVVITYSANEEQKTALDAINIALDDLANNLTDPAKLTAAQAALTNALDPNYNIQFNSSQSVSQTNQQPDPAKAFNSTSGGQAVPIMHLLEQIQRDLKQTPPNNNLRIVGIPTMNYLPGGGCDNASDQAITESLTKLQVYANAGAHVRVLADPDASSPTNFKPPSIGGPIAAHNFSHDTTKKQTYDSQRKQIHDFLTSLVNTADPTITPLPNPTVDSKLASTTPGYTALQKVYKVQLGAKCLAALIHALKTQAQAAAAGTTVAVPAPLNGWKIEAISQHTSSNINTEATLISAAASAAAGTPAITAPPAKYQATIPADPSAPNSKPQQFDFEITPQGGIVHEVNFPAKADHAAMEQVFLQDLKNFCTLNPHQAEVKIDNLPPALRTTAFLQKMESEVKTINPATKVNCPEIAQGATITASGQSISP